MQRIIVSLLIGIIGYLLAAKPAQVWQLTESWKTLGEVKPSPILLSVLRTVGSCLMVGAVLIVLFRL